MRGNCILDRAAACCATTGAAWWTWGRAANWGCRRGAAARSPACNLCAHTGWARRGMGGELSYVVSPAYSYNPLSDDSLDYHHEAVLENASIDMQAAHLPKFIK